MVDLGLLKDDELTRVGRFLEEHVEVNLFPRVGGPPGEHPREYKESLLDLLMRELPHQRTFPLYATDVLTHVLALRFVRGGIPSNPVEVHCMSSLEGVVTVEPVFIPQGNTRILELDPDEKKQALRALRVMGFLRWNHTPQLDMGAREMLPPRGYRVDEWEEALEEPRESRTVWRFRF